MVAKDPLKNWDPKFGRFHSIWAGEAATEWASKYGVLPEAMDPTQLFFPYKKSALTPHALDNPRLKAERKNHQKWILSGYWPELLEEIGAYPYPLNYLPVLTNPIDPIFQLNQWQPPHTLETWPIIRMEFPPHKPFFPIEPDNTGLWTADNPAVWRRLDPILRLCTRLLHHSAATCWLDAFYFGDRTDVPERLDRRPAWQKLEQGPLKFFHKRDPWLLNTAKTAEKTALLKTIMRKRVQFGIGSSFLTPWDRRTPNGSGLGWEGFTIVSTERQSKNLEFYTENKAWIEIALELLLPLFRNDLSPIEKLSCQFYIASTLLHEFAHSLNQLQESPMGRTIIRNEPAYGGDVKGNGAEVFCELGYSFVKGLLGAMPKILNPGIIVGAPAVTLLLSKEIPARKYDKGIFLHEAGEHFAQYEATNKLVPIVSKYYEYIHNDGFWDKVATNFGVSIIAPTPAPVVVVEPDPSRPELSSYVFNNSQRKWMYEVQAIKSNAQLLSSLTPEQRKAYDVALVQKDDELNKLRKLKYLHVRDKTAKSVNECNAALESFFTRSPGELSDSEILRLLGCFAETLKREADQETQCAIDFMAEAELETPFNVEFKQRLLDINRVARKMVGKASADCERVGVATLGPDFHELRAKFDRTLYILRAINFILVQQVKADKNETYEEVIDRVGTAMDYEGLERLQSSDAQDEIAQSASQETITAQAMNAYQKHDYVECHRLGGVLLSQFDLEGYAQGIGMVLIAMHPGEIRRRWCARQGLHVLNIMVKSNANPFLELWVEVAMQVHDAIEDLAVNTGIGDTLCVLEID
ncbi:hypothetical protein BCIN_07g03740 [Botrytis cinerea B05.10]|uniref:Uncharacterized protein n=1 Tax=Botryotinia fuckeliana (strain B05.10) TaxID=332648 RepID=A0A384JML7_BOTFB|nr:hypothetical protein BCIN_07g03740 [Botrytis cinerea B05.10]ATZ51803.1 hypothetical protein BCIN_07g03740 [Botrytis cinerea B05.10]